MVAGFIRRFLDARAGASSKKAEFKKLFDELLCEFTPHLSGRTFDYGNLITRTIDTRGDAVICRVPRNEAEQGI